MQVTVLHSLTMTSPVNPAYENTPADWNASHVATVVLGTSDVIGISAGASSLSTGLVVFANSNSVSFGLNNGTITASIGAAGGGVALSAGTTQASSGTVQFADSNGVSWGLNGQTLTATVKTDYQSSGPYLTTAALSQDSSKYAGTNGAITGGSITVNTSGVSVNLPAYITTARASTDGIGLNTAGTHITWTANSSGLSIDNSGLAGTGYTSTSTNVTNLVGTLNSAGLSVGVPSWILNVNITAGTTHQAINNWSWADSNGVSFGLNVKTLTASVNTSYRASNDAVGLNTAQTNVTWTVNSSGISLNAGGYAGTTLGIGTQNGSAINATLNTAGLSLVYANFITTARASTDAVGLNTAQTNVTWTVNSSGLSLNAGGYAGTGITTATTTGTALVGTHNTAGLSLGVPKWLTAAAGGGGVALYDGANSITSGTAQFTNANGVSFTFNGQTISGSVNTSYRASNDAIGLNTAQTNVTWTVNSSGLSLNAAGYAGTGTSLTNATATLNSNGLQLSVAAPGGAVTISSYENIPLFNTQVVIIGSTGQMLGAAFLLPQAGSFSFLRLLANLAAATGTLTTNGTLASGGASHIVSLNAVAYSLGTGANSKSLQSVASGSAAYTNAQSYSFNTANSAWSITQAVTAPFQGGTVQQSTQWSSTTSAISLTTTYLTNFTGTRFYDIPFATSLSAGNYWMFFAISATDSTSGPSGNSGQMTRLLSYNGHLVVSQQNAGYPQMGDTGQVTGGFLGIGSFSTNASTTASIPMSLISSSASNPHIYFQMLRSA